MLTIQLDMLQTAALAMILFLIGRFTVSHVAFFQRCCIPAPVIGGLIFAILHLVAYQTGILTFTFDETLKTAFMDFFFTSVGFGASIKLLKKGAWPVILFLILATILVTIQNLVGVGLSGLFDLDGRLGLCMSSIPLVGGHGTSASFGPLFEGMGVEGATTVAVACATYGLVAGSLMGGPVARSLIVKHNLRSTEGHAAAAKSAETLAADVAGEDESFTSASPRFVKGFMLLLAALGIGAQISVWLTDLTGLTFPSYIGAMLTAVVIRNVMIAVKVEYPDQEIDTMGTMFLSIFLALALSSLKLWELVDLALPMIICLLLQCVVMVIFSYFVVFNVMGRDYEAAVMSAGFIGFAMGATSNAMANMQVVTKKYGPAPVAYFAIPMVGGMFIDFFNAVLITFNINLFVDMFH